MSWTDACLDLVALDAGCSQQPVTGHVLGLNGSVFSPSTIGIVDPALVTPTATPNSSSTGLPSNIIAAIISVVVIVLLIAAAFVFICMKKRQNRRKRASYAAKFKGWGGGSSHSQMPQSPLSFQCQTRMDPTSPKFFQDDDSNKEDPSHTSFSRKPSLRNHHHAAITSFQPISAITETPAHPKRESRIHQNPLQYHPPSSSHPVPLPNLDTNPGPLPSYPTPTHASPLSSSSYHARFSPDSYTTPTSALSTRSNAPLLPPYIPAQHASTPPLRGPHNIPAIVTSPVSSSATTTQGGPLLMSGGAAAVAAGSANRDSSASAPAPPPKSPRMMIGVAIDGVEGLVNFKVPRGRGAAVRKESGSPVESRKVVSVFPPPPPPPRR